MSLVKGKYPVSRIAMPCVFSQREISIESECNDQCLKSNNNVIESKGNVQRVKGQCPMS